jgi:multidrug efflux pump
VVFLPGWGSSDSVNSAVALVTMSPWEDRKLSTQEVMTNLSAEWRKIPGIRAFPFMRSGVQKGGGGQSVQFVVGGSNYEELAEWRDTILARAQANPGFARVQADYKETKPQLKFSFVWHIYHKITIFNICEINKYNLLYF